MATRNSASRFDSGSSKKKGLRISHDRAPDGDALALPAGKRFRLALQVRRDLQHLRRVPDEPVDLPARKFRVLEAERHVFEYRHVRVKRIGLKYHR